MKVSQLLKPSPVFLILWLILIKIKESHESIKNKIVGGYLARIEENPHIVGIAHYGKPNFCGGSIITKRHVLSAGHCFKSEKRFDLVVFSGAKFNDGSDGNIHLVEDINVHEDYEVIENDIALVTIYGEFKFSSKVQPIQIAHLGFRVYDGDICIVAGWGATEENGILSMELMEAQVPIYNNKKCLLKYQGHITKNMLCAGYTYGGIDACQGDSGGPLTLKNKLIGIVSFGQGCGGHYPGVYTDVRRYHDWIKNNIN